LPRPLILFGPWDRHNLGDLLLGQVHASLWRDRPLAFAGLAARDLRALGGVDVRPLAECMPGPTSARAGAVPSDGDAAPALLHIGGEILTCPAWHAAVMLLPPAEVPATVGWLEREPAAREAWLRARLGTPGGRLQQAPYVASRREWPRLGPVALCAAGGVDLDACAPEMRAEVVAKLRAADRVTVRDASTLRQLRKAGVEATLQPDAAVMAADLFGPTIAHHAATGEPAAVRAAMPRGYLALQAGPDFVDDATLRAIATAAAAVAGDARLGIVLFRAGAAPWHDDLEALQRVAALVGAALRTRRGRRAVGAAHAVPDLPVRVFASLRLWDLCALIANARACVSSSLHVAIVSGAFARPRVLIGPGRPGKAAAWVRTWEPAEARAAVVEPAALEDALRAALAADPRALHAAAMAQVARCRAGLDALRPVLDDQTASPSTSYGQSARPPASDSARKPRSRSRKAAALLRRPLRQ
jgi:hypothetical protein